MLPLQKLYCDNLGLIKEVSSFFKYQLTKVKCVLHSEYNVVNQIFPLLQDYTVTPKINNVKGHQDSKIPYTSLPLPAQLNVDAGGLATKELWEQPDLIYQVPLFPHSKEKYYSVGHVRYKKSFGHHPQAPRISRSDSLHARVVWLDCRHHSLR
jgi:hypothetical protein